MIDYISNLIKYISSTVANNPSNIYIISGDEGIGKTTVAQKLGQLYDEYLTLCCNDEFQLITLIQNNSESCNATSQFYIPLIREIKEKNIHNLIIDTDKNVSEDFLEFITNFFGIINQQGYALNLIIFLDAFSLNHYYRVFNIYPKCIYLNPFKKWQTEDFIQLWCDIYKNKPSDVALLSLISEYSMGNAGVFLQHLNTLKYNRCLVFSNSTWSFENKDVVEKILKEEYSQLVAEKYASLPRDLQLIIQKTSSIGNVFQSSTLREAFNEKNATILLERIEKLTMLLYYTDQSKENGKFDSEETHRHIEEMIAPELLESWCEVIGQYYENKLKSSKKSSVADKLKIKERCVFYYKKSHNNEKLVFHYISLITLQCRFCRYKAAINAAESLLALTMQNSRYSNVAKDCYYMLAVIYRLLANYPKAIEYLKKYIAASGNPPLEVKLLNAKLLYDNGDTTKAYLELMKLYKQKQQISDPTILVDIISTISSIEETLGHKDYIFHFNEALASAADNKLELEYYRLLRKANMAHSGENSIRLMIEAKKYFGDKNLSEYIMVLHNIATEALFYENTFKYTLANLDEAYKIAVETGFSQLCYINNSYAVHLILDGRYSEAMDILEDILRYPQEDFTKLAVWLNEVTCLRLIERFEEAADLLKKANQTNRESRNRFPFFSAQISLQEAYMCIQTNEAKHTSEKIINYINKKYDDRSVNIISAKLVLKSLCDRFDLKPPKILRNFADDCDEISKKMADNYLVLCDLMFWE